MGDTHKPNSIYLREFSVILDGGFLSSNSELCIENVHFPCCAIEARYACGFDSRRYRLGHSQLIIGRVAIMGLAKPDRPEPASTG